MQTCLLTEIDNATNQQSEMTMKTNTQFAFDADHRAGQGGAALLMTLMVSTLLLILGGALILTTGMATGLAVDSTPELQAYYAAEAGMNTALHVLRKNVQSSPAGTTATLRNAVDNPTLSPWMTYGATISGYSVVSLNTSPVTGYAIRVTDPDGVPAGTEPNRVLVRVTGYGPSGSVKRLETLVDRRLFEFTAVSTILVRGNDDGTSKMGEFEMGKSNAKEYSGYDHSHPTSSIPVFGVTHSNDLADAEKEVKTSKPDTVSGTDKVKQFNISDLPSFLQTADNARAFLNTMKETAAGEGRHFTSTPPNFGTADHPQLTFVEGNCALNDGAGVLIVTGKLTGSGNVGFKGIILVLGEGVFERDGGGNGDTYGAIVVAKFARTWPTSEDGDPHPFLSATYNMKGGGNANTGYDSESVTDALNAAGMRTKAIREY
jgi:hypothetical protein